MHHQWLDLEFQFVTQVRGLNLAAALTLRSGPARQRGSL